MALPSNAGPPIHLAKASLLELLKTHYISIKIPSRSRLSWSTEEEKGSDDAVLVEESFQREMDSGCSD